MLGQIASIFLLARQCLFHLKSCEYLSAIETLCQSHEISSAIR